MICPPTLTPGDTIALAAPSRWVEPDTIHKAKRFIESRGYRALELSALMARQGQFAGSDAQRAQGLIEAWEDDSVKAIWAARGGYGAQRLLRELEASLNTEQAKWFIGFSDSTAIHGLLQSRGICSIHGPLLSTMQTQSAEDVQAVFDLLESGRQPRIDCAAHRHNRLGEAEGRLLGGNLSLVQTMIGTQSLAIEEGDILFIEDIDEMLYHLDRMLLHLDRAGVLAKLSGFCVGGLSAMRDNTRAHGFSQDNPYGLSAEEVVAERLRGYSFPVLFDLPCGHAERNVPLLLGGQVKLEVDTEGGRLLPA